MTATQATAALPCATCPIPDPRKYRQLAAQLRADLEAGTIPPGASLSIGTLSRERGWSRETCAKALRVLVDDGWLTLYPGAGYTVTADVP
jgi:DNA-binding GntR family transcriptional regulator